MSDKINPQIRDLYNRAMELPDGEAKLGFIEQAIDISDRAQDTILSYRLRKEMLEAALSAGDHRRLLVAFSWCLAKQDEDPELEEFDSVLWEYRWVISVLPTFPEIPLSKINEMIVDMTRRYERAGASLRAVHLLNRKVCIDTGDVEGAKRLTKLWREAPVDGFTNDSIETEISFEITYQFFLKKYDKTLDFAEPFMTGALTCDHFEGHVYSKILLPLLRRGRVAEAMQYHRRGYKLRAKNNRYFDSIAEHIGFLGLTDNLTRGLKLFEKHLPVCIDSPNQFSRMWFFMDSLPLFQRLVKAKQATIRLKLPPKFPGYSGKNTHNTKEFYQHLLGLAQDMAKRFDERNQNTHYTDYIENVLRYQRWFEPHPWNE